MTRTVEVAVRPVECIVSSIPTGSPCLDCGPTASDYMKLPPDATNPGPDDTGSEGPAQAARRPGRPTVSISRSVNPIGPMRLTARNRLTVDT